MSDHIKSLHKKIRKMSNAHALSQYDYGPRYTIDTGSALFNLQLSGNVYGGYEGRSITSVAGYSQSGKTRWAYQAMKLFLNSFKDGIVVWVDGENAFKADNESVFNKEEVSQKYGDRFIYIKENILEDVQSNTVALLNHFKEENYVEKDIKVFFVIDSWGFLVTSENMEKVEKVANAGEDTDIRKKGVPEDMGRTAKKKKSFIMNILNKVPAANTTMLITNHLYGSMSQYEEDKFAGGSGLHFGAQSIAILAALKAGAAKDPIRKKARKIRSRMLKGREVRPFTETNMPLLFEEGGFTRYGGLAEWCIEMGILEPNGGRPLKYGWAHEDPETRELLTLEEIEQNQVSFFTPERLDFVNQIGKKVFCFDSEEERNESHKQQQENQKEYE